MLHSVVQYELLGRIAKGGMAEVYLCRAKGVGGYQKLLVIKKIRSDFADSKDFIDMFMDEAAISALLQHRSIGQVFDFGRVKSTYIIAMEYIHGVSLRDILKLFTGGKGAPPPALAAFIMAEICGALHYAHTKESWQGRPLGIIHRDVNPRNVMVTLEGEVKLIDFGIAKAAQRNYMTVSGIKGKVSYMSPEQAAGLEVDHRSDIFSAGVLLFELLTGRKLFDGDNDISILKRVEQADIPKPSAVAAGTDPRLEAICLAALARNREERYASAREMQSCLEEVCHAEQCGSWQLGIWMKAHFTERLARVSELLSDRTRTTPSPEALVHMEPTDIFLTPDEAGAAGPGDEGPTHFFIGPEERGGSLLSEQATLVRLPGGSDDTIVDNSAVHFTQARPMGSTLRLGVLVALVILAACVASGVTFFLASRGSGLAQTPATAPDIKVPVVRADSPAPLPPDMGSPDLPALAPEVILLPDAGKTQNRPVRRIRPNRKRPRKGKKKRKDKVQPLPY